MQGKNANVIKFDNRDYSCECYQCGNTFEATRSDATFCSAKCRVAYSREPKKLQNAIEALGGMAVELKRLSKKYKHSDRVMEEMLKLQKEIGIALSNFEEE